MPAPILSVVRYRSVDGNDEALFQRSMFNAGWHVERYTEAERRESFREHVAHHNARAGRYVKSGGGAPTANLQEAQIFGWSRSAKNSLARHDVDYYEILPARIAID